MLNTDSIRDKILDDAKRSAAQIISDADVRAQNIREASEKRVSDAKLKAMRAAESQADEMRDRMLRMAELDLRKDLLAIKRRAIDEAFAMAMQRILAMDTPTARAFIQAQLLKNAGGRETIVIDAKDEKLYTAAFLSEVNALLKKSGRSGELKLDGERRKMSGGFILKDGGAEIMCTYDAIMNEARASLEGDVLKLLFPEQ